MQLSENAKVVLMLCCPFQAKSEEEEKNQVLSPGEWHSFAHLLKQRSLEPEDLLSLNYPQLEGLLEGDPLMKKVGAIHSLLRSGGTLSFHLESLGNRGIQVVTLVDDDYPERLRKRLGNQAPPFLFYAGDKALLGQPGIAVVGSRQIDQRVLQITRELGEICGQAGLVVYSGGAKGVDETCMKAALEGVDGYTVGVLAHPLTEVMRTVEYRRAIEKKRMCLATPFLPEKGFQVWKAMYRNAIIYALADVAVVIQSDLNKGGTWAGAKENLKKRWVPLFVVDWGAQTPAGNRELIKQGGINLPHPYPFDGKSIKEWFQQRVAGWKSSVLDEGDNSKAAPSRGEKAVQLSLSFPEAQKAGPDRAKKQQ
ncbi:MAG: putative DNA processing chain A [Anaerolineae bacterium]|nr:MAG: putative DNA processing chain A [Anaerolineae bacterium]